MNLDQHKQNWKDHHNMLAADYFENTTTDIVGQAIAMEKSMLRSDRIELWAAALVAIILVAVLTSVSLALVMKLGFAIAGVSGIASVLSLNSCNRNNPKPSPDLSPGDFCRAELKRIDRRIEFTQKYLWRFALPITIGFCVFFLGMFLEFKRIEPTMSYTFICGWLAAFGFCFLLFMIVMKRSSDRDIRNRYAPIRDDLKAVIDSLSESNDNKGGTTNFIKLGTDD